MIISPDYYYVGMWYADLPAYLDQRGNITATIWREPGEPDTTYHLHWRFRWYRDKKIFESNDDKSNYRGTATDKTEDEVVASLYVLAKQLGLKWDACMLRCSGKEAVDRLIANPPSWMHVKTLEGEEAEEAKKRYGLT